MKKILLVLVLMFSLVGCTQETTTVMIYPEMSYLSFSDHILSEPADQLTQDEDVYYIYFYGSVCSACQKIKNEALYTIEFLHDNVVYFVEISQTSDISINISLAGTPSLVKVVNGEAVEVSTGGTSVLNTLHDLT